jgi:hypothetical protein
MKLGDSKFINLLTRGVGDDGLYRTHESVLLGVAAALRDLHTAGGFVDVRLSARTATQFLAAVNDACALLLSCVMGGPRRQVLQHMTRENFQPTCMYSIAHARISHSHCVSLLIAV